jgi:hypothetical protein
LNVYAPPSDAYVSSWNWFRAPTGVSFDTVTVAPSMQYDLIVAAVAGLTTSAAVAAAHAIAIKQIRIFTALLP